MKSQIAEMSKDDVIGCYWPIQDELDTRPLISELIKKKIKIALPVILDNCMLFKSWNINDWPICRYSAMVLHIYGALLPSSIDG